MNKWFFYYKADTPGSGIGVKTAPVTKTGEEIDIPANADWTDHGIILSEGGAGSWDVRFYGALSPCAVVKKNGTYYLYYIGADGDRSFDSGPRHRALGVAYSTDGINFTKYSGNPILTFLPHNGEEEGIFSAGAFLDDNDEVVLYYSALDNAGVPETVNSDVRLAVSSNGLNFSDQGEVLSHDDNSVWGYGDELFPAGTFRHDTTYHVYYIAKGVGAYWDVGLAQGPARNNIDGNTQKVLDAGSNYVKGIAGPMYISTVKLALFIARESLGVEVRTLTTSNPETLSGAVETYGFTLPAIYLNVEEEEEEIMQPIFI